MQQPESKSNNNRKQQWRILWKTSLLLFTASQIYVFLRLCIFTSCVIPTYSMSPTLTAGDYIYVAIKDPVISRNDIVVFNFPYAEMENKMMPGGNMLYCKRCIAIPGDTFFIDKQGVYHVKGSEEIIGKRMAQIAAGPILVNYDSLYIPRTGDSIQIDSLNFNCYHACIEYETGKQLYLYEGKIYMDGVIIDYYHFQKNYYYMAGDNVSDSYDSRYWGLLPEDFILGIGRFIWFSEDPNTSKIRWERIFKQL